MVWPNTLVLCFHSRKERAKGSKSLPHAQATLLLKSDRECSFLQIRLAGVSQGEAPVKTAISEAPMVWRLARTQALLRWVKPVCRCCKKALKALTLTDIVADTPWVCFSNRQRSQAIPFPGGKAAQRKAIWGIGCGAVFSNKRSVASQ